MDKGNWNNVRNRILDEVYEEMRKYVTSERRIAVNNIINKYFKKNTDSEKLPEQPYYLIYDKPLFDELCSLIADKDHEFNYTIKPTLRKDELTTIIEAMDTIMVIIFHCNSTLSGIDILRYELACFLSENYDIATPQFIVWYDELFTKFNERNRTELSGKHVKTSFVESIVKREEIVNHKLFTKIVLFIRSLLADTINCPCELKKI
jgi:hypothetical protein